MMKFLITLTAFLHILFIAAVKSEVIEEYVSNSANKGEEEGNGVNAALNIEGHDFSAYKDRNIGQNEIDKNNYSDERGAEKNINYNYGEPNSKIKSSTPDIEFNEPGNSNLLGNSLVYLTKVIKDHKGSKDKKTIDSSTKSNELLEDISFSTAATTPVTDQSNKEEISTSSNQDLYPNSLTTIKKSKYTMNYKPNNDFGKKDNGIQTNNIQRKNDIPVQERSNIITDIGKNLLNSFISSSKDDLGVTKDATSTFSPNSKDGLGIAKNLLNTFIPSSKNSLDVAKNLINTFIPDTKDNKNVAKNLLNTIIPNSKDGLDVAKNLLNTFIPDPKDNNNVAKNLLNTIIPNSKESLDVAKNLLNTFIPDSKDNKSVPNSGENIDVAKHLLNSFIPSAKDGLNVAKNILNTFIPDAKENMSVSKNILNTFTPNSKGGIDVAKDLLNTFISNSKDDSGSLDNAYNSVSNLFQEHTDVPPILIDSSKPSNKFSSFVSNVVKEKNENKINKENDNSVQYDVTVDENKRQVEYETSNDSKKSLYESKNSGLPERNLNSIPTTQEQTTVKPNYQYLLEEINNNIRTIREHITKNTSETVNAAMPDNYYNTLNVEESSLNNTLNVEQSETSSTKACSSNLYDLAFRPQRENFNFASQQTSNLIFNTADNFKKQSLACLNPPCIIRFCPHACACPLYCSEIQQSLCPCCPLCDPYPHYLYPPCNQLSYTSGLY